jgi:hypothetical protein
VRYHPAKAAVAPVDDLDGPIAAPDHHKVVFENEHVRVLETVIRVGDTAPLHTHLSKHVMLVSSGSHFIRRDAAGAVLLDTRAQEPPVRYAASFVEQRDSSPHPGEHRGGRNPHHRH